MFILYLIISIISAVYTSILLKQKFLHVTFRLFVSSVVCELLSFLFTLSEYAQFSSSGISTPGMITVAMMFDAAAQVLFLLMLILLAKGYNVTRGKLKKKTMIKIAIFFSAYLFAVFFTFIYAQLVNLFFVLKKKENFRIFKVNFSSFLIQV